MKYRDFFTMTLLMTLALVGCTTRPKAQVPTEIPTTGPAKVSAATSKPTSTPSDEAQVRHIVQDFGERLKMVSLLAPDAAQQIDAQYSEYASPDLLAAWGKDTTKAPGRLTSSPWPDRIEITDVAKESTGKFMVKGVIVEVTSMELANGGAAEKIPVQIIVQDLLGQWLITQYTSGKSTR